MSRMWVDIREEMVELGLLADSRSYREWFMPQNMTDTDYETLPPDLTGNCMYCESWLDDDRLWCTRRQGHTGRHAAGDGCKVIGVWE